MRAAVRRTARFDIVQLLYFRSHPYSVDRSVSDVAFAFSRRTQLSRCFSVPKQAWSFFCDFFFCPRGTSNWTCAGNAFHLVHSSTGGVFVESAWHDAHKQYWIGVSEHDKHYAASSVATLVLE